MYDQDAALERPDETHAPVQVSEADPEQPEPSEEPEEAGSGGADVSSKASRIDEAKRALTRAEISRRQREKDPEGYKKWNRERMKERRKRGKS